MSAQYSFFIYISIDKLEACLEHIYCNSNKDKTDIVVNNKKLYKKDKKSGTTVLLDNFGVNETFDVCLRLEKDNALLQYYIDDAINWSKKLKDYQVSSDIFFAPTVTLLIRKLDYKEREIIELEFNTCSTSISREIFSNSISMQSFIKNLCKYFDGICGYLWMEYKYRLLWFNGEEFDCDVSANAVFDNFSFFEIITEVLEGKL